MMRMVIASTRYGLGPLNSCIALRQQHAPQTRSTFTSTRNTFSYLTALLEIWHATQHLNCSCLRVLRKV